MRLISTLLCSLFIFVSAVLVYGWQSEVKTAKSNPTQTKAGELFQSALDGVTTQKPEVVFREFDEAVALWKTAGETDRAAQASLQLGKSFLDEKKFLNALRLLKQAVEFKPSPSPVASISYESIGRVYADLHQHDLALYYYDKALTSTSHTKDDLTRAKIICDQATLYFKFKEIDQADDYLRQASGLNHNLGDKNVEATVRYLSGLIAMNKGHTDESRESLKMALALSKDLADVPRQIEALCALSELSLQLNQVETASDWARQASGLSEGLSQHSNPEHVKRRTKEVAWYSYLTLALVQKAAGINSEAQHSYFFAIGGIELLYLSTYVSTDNSAMSFGENRQLPFDGSIELYMGDGKYSDAFFISEQYRARSLLGLLRTDDTAATTAAKNPDPEIQRLSGSLAQLRTELYSSGVRDKRRTELRGETGQAAFALAEARLASEMDHFRDKVTWKDVVSIPVMQKQLGDDNNLKNTSVLEFFLGKEHSFAWLISSNEVFTAELPARNVVEDQVNEYLKLIASPPNSLYLKQGLVKEKDSGQKLFSSL